MALRIPTTLQCKVRPIHLRQLPAVKELLLALNDPYAASERVTELMERLPILSGRCIRRAAEASPDKPLESLEQVMTLIGNRGLEAELLTLLEDLTMLKYEVEDSGR